MPQEGNDGCGGKDGDSSTSRSSEMWERGGEVAG